MRFMILVKASKESEAGMMPSEQILTEMGKFNEELAAYSAEIATDSEAKRHSLRRKSAVREVGAKRRWEFYS